MAYKGDYGVLLNQNTKLHRRYFNEMVRLIGVQVLYKAPKENKHYNLQSELISNYEDPIKVGCIFEEKLTQRTAKKLGWIAELQESAALIHVPYDLPGLQIGALFTIPSAYDNTKGRTFRVVRMSAIMVFPASITCEIVPEYETTIQPAELQLFNSSDFNLLNEG
ncbi:MAG: hypothetical protein IJH65_03265 [Methanobrevibacter sp.]|nr:hypothetical protein [Methanobrevibacter sp.]